MGEPGGSGKPPLSSRPLQPQSPPLPTPRPPTGPSPCSGHPGVSRCQPLPGGASKQEEARLGCRRGPHQQAEPREGGGCFPLPGRPPGSTVHLREGRPPGCRLVLRPGRWTDRPSLQGKLFSLTRPLHGLRRGHPGPRLLGAEWEAPRHARGRRAPDPEGPPLCSPWSCAPGVWGLCKCRVSFCTV